MHRLAGHWEPDIARKFGRGEPAGSHTIDIGSAADGSEADVWATARTNISSEIEADAVVGRMNPARR